MKKIMACLCAAIAFGIFLTRITHADELTDLKIQQALMLSDST